MPTSHFIPEVVSLRARGLDERWLQDRIAEDPKILGLGDLILKDRERRHLNAGRLDLLLQDPETNRRYEVEIQLGRTDESHIIRTLEYWDIERKRYPQYEHCAVIVAEEITSRFLNVISLFNGHIPLIAVKLQAIVVDGRVGLIFTRVLDEVTLGLVDEDEEVQGLADRAYWEEKSSPSCLKLADRVFEWIRTFAPECELKYNRHYIGLSVDGQPNNFVVLKPQKNALQLRLKLPESQEMSDRLEREGLDVLGYLRPWGYYRLRVDAEDLEKRREVLVGLMKEARAAFE